MRAGFIKLPQVLKYFYEAGIKPSNSLTVLRCGSRVLGGGGGGRLGRERAEDCSLHKGTLKRAASSTVSQRNSRQLLRRDLWAGWLRA